MLAALPGVCGLVLVLGSGSLCLARFLCLLLSWYLWLGASGLSLCRYPFLVLPWDMLVCILALGLTSPVHGSDRSGYKVEVWSISSMSSPVSVCVT